MSGGDERVTITLTPEPDRGRGILEMSGAGYSADQIAEFRARRILLNEQRPIARESSGSQILLESLVRGLNTDLSVERSPLPALYATLGAGDPGRFVRAAELVAVLWLRLSGTVAHVLDLDIRLTGGHALTAHFRGERRREASNREPALITVDGQCALDPR